MFWRKKDVEPSADRFAVVRRGILNCVVAMFVCILCVGIFAPRFLWHVISIEVFVVCFSMIWLTAMTDYNASLTQLYRIGGKANSEDERTNKLVLFITSAIRGLLTTIVLIVLLQKFVAFVVEHI